VRGTRNGRGAGTGHVAHGSAASDTNARAEIELRCGAIASGGGCVARAEDGRVVFVRHSLPGELVRARVTAETTSYLRADAVEVIEPSADRVEPACPYAGPGRCGGCDWQHVALPAQRELKAELVAEQLRRVAGVDRRVVVEPLPDEGGLGWRTRVRFAVDPEGRVGLRRHRSHEVEHVDRCAIATDGVELPGVERLTWPGAREVEVFAPSRGGADEHAAVVVVTPARREGRLPSPPTLADDATGLVVARTTVREPARVRARVHGRSFRISAGSFWQIHEAAPGVLARAVIDGLAPRRGDHVLELFAGVGLFSALLADAVGPRGSVRAVERDPGSCADARHNVRHLAQVEIVEAPVTPEILDGRGRTDLVVLDPPRDGAGIDLVTALAAMTPAPRRIAYVACDPASFARDLEVARRAGWTLASLRAFDQFPMTEHVELVAVLEPMRAS